MKLFKKLRKGFTLIELVVVIAVIAILSAVSVVSYIAITNKAKESNDHMMIDQINLSVEGSSVQSRKATLHEVLEDLKEDAGFGVEKLTPELKDTEFVYSYSMNKFAYWKSNKVVYPKDVAESSTATGEDLWFFKDVQRGASLAEGHSYYVKSAPANATITVDGGLDVGSQSFSSITYANNSSAKEVVIRTNDMSCDLIINAPKDVVRHYGQAQSIDVVAVKPTSYHEYGAAPFISVTSGRVILESSAQVEALHVESSSAVLAIASSEALPTVTVEEGISSFKVETTKKDSGETLTSSNVTINTTTGAVSLDKQSTALSGNEIVETAEKEDAKGEAVANSDLVFQVNGSWAAVAANARTVLNDYLRVYNSSTTLLPGGSNDGSVSYTPEELSQIFTGLKDYYVEVGTIHINVGKITLNGIEINSSTKFSLSVASYRFVSAAYFKIQNNKLFLAAPVAAFELNTSGAMKINNTNISLGNDVVNTLSVKAVRNGNTGTQFVAHTSDDYAFDISKASTTTYTSIAFNEISSAAAGPIVTRKFYTYADGVKKLSYGLSTVDNLTGGNFGIQMYITGYPVNSIDSGTHFDYSLYFMEANKTCALHFDIVD